MIERSTHALASATPVTVTRTEGPPARGVVLVPDIMGLRPLFDDLAGELAERHQYAVAAVEPWPGQQHLSNEERLAQVGYLDDERLLGDASHAADLLGVEPVAVLGFCMGGMVALKASALDRFDRGVSFYGMVRLPQHWRSPTMHDAIESLTSAEPGPGGVGGSAPDRPPAAKVLAVVGTDDPFLPPSDVAELEAAGATVVRYEGAQHGFVHDPSRPAHRPHDAADAWHRVTDWLAVPR